MKQQKSEKPTLLPTSEATVCRYTCYNVYTIYRTREYTEIVQLLQEKMYSTQQVLGLKPAVIASWAP